MQKKGKDSPCFLSRVGEKYTTNEVFKIEIIEYFNWDNCTIQFEDGTIKENVSYSNIKKGAIKKLTERVGQKFITNEGYEVEVIEYFGVRNCTVQFKNGLKLYNVFLANLLKGCIKNPNHPSICGVGYLGAGKYKASNDNKSYSIWRSTIQRCYNRSYQKRHPTYIGCSVDKRWYNFQVFAEWFENNYKDGFELDKDVLTKGNKIYSPETCRFIPQEINCLFTKRQNCRGGLPIGVVKSRKRFIAQIQLGNGSKYLGTFDTPEEAFHAYKIAKEVYIKEVADEWRDRIDDEIYFAMYAYKVEIID